MLREYVEIDNAFEFRLFIFGIVYELCTNDNIKIIEINNFSPGYYPQ